MQPQDGEAERKLIEAAQRGDQGAFSELVRLHDRSVLRIALRILRSPEDARDAYQEAFLKVYRKLDTFRFQCRFHTWLYRIATNVCLDHLRRRKARPEFTALDTAETSGRSPIEAARATEPLGSPDRMLGNREASERITRAMRDPVGSRALWSLHCAHHEGMRLKAIGEACSISEDSAKQCLFRATRKLRKELHDVRGLKGLPPWTAKSCGSEIRLYLYGELSLAERHEVERCRAEDPAFRALVDDEESFLLALSDPELDTDIDPLLEECREGLARAVAIEQSPQRGAWPFSQIRQALGPRAAAIAGHRMLWQPALAALLLAIGFLAGSSNPGGLLRTSGIPASYGSSQTFSLGCEPDADRRRDCSS